MSERNSESTDRHPLFYDVAAIKPLHHFWDYF